MPPTTSETARVGTWVKIPSLVTVELLCHTGYDFLVLDLEHAPLSLDFCHAATAVAQGYGVDLLVRAPDCSGRGLQPLLDLGVDGVIAPQVAGVGDARAFLSATLFPPLGTRGVGLTSRAGRWGLREMDSYLAGGPRGLQRCVQFETPGAFDDLDEILGLEGLGSTLFGPADLALHLGHPADSDEVQAWGLRLLARCLEVGVEAGYAAAGPQAAVEAIEAGFGFVLVASDASLFANAARGVLRETQFRSRREG